MSTHIHVRDISHAIHGVCTLWFTYDSMPFIMRTVYSRNTAPHKPPASKLPGVFLHRRWEYLSRPNLAKGGAEQLSGKEKPSRVY